MSLQQQRGRIQRTPGDGVPSAALRSAPRRSLSGFELRFCATSMETTKITPWESKPEPGSGKRRGSSPAESWAELGHRLSARQMRSGEAVESLPKQQLWGQEEKTGACCPCGLWGNGRCCYDVGWWPSVRKNVLARYSTGGEENEQGVDVSPIRAGLGSLGGVVPWVGGSPERLVCPSQVR